MTSTAHIYGMDPHPESFLDRIFAGFDDIMGCLAAWLFGPRSALA